MRHPDVTTDHRKTTVDQFTRQADAFSSSPTMRDEKALRLIVDASGVSSDDTVLDVACGPGIVTCELAAVARRATGIDLTPAMIERARALQLEKKLSNITWHVGDVSQLPYGDRTFSIVVSRYALHHMARPGAVFAEMNRVCKTGGKVLVVDATASSDPEKAERFNRMERVRDPSHVRALTLAQLRELFAGLGMLEPDVTHHRVEFALGAVLEGSFPKEKDGKQTVRKMFEESLADDGMALKPERVDGEVRFSYPISILAATRVW